MWAAHIVQIWTTMVLGVLRSKGWYAQVIKTSQPPKDVATSHRALLGRLRSEISVSLRVGARESRDGRRHSRFEFRKTAPVGRYPKLLHAHRSQQSACPQRGALYACVRLDHASKSQALAHAPFSLHPNTQHNQQVPQAKPSTHYTPQGRNTRHCLGDREHTRASYNKRHCNGHTP